VTERENSPDCSDATPRQTMSAALLTGRVPETTTEEA